MIADTIRNMFYSAGTDDLGIANLLAAHLANCHIYFDHHSRVTGAVPHVIDNPEFDTHMAKCDRCTPDKAHRYCGRPSRYLVVWLRDGIDSYARTVEHVNEVARQFLAGAHAVLKMQRAQAEMADLIAELAQASKSWLGFCRIMTKRGGMQLSYDQRDRYGERLRGEGTEFVDAVLNGRSSGIHLRYGDYPVADDITTMVPRRGVAEKCELRSYNHGFITYAGGNRVTYRPWNGPERTVTLAEALWLATPAKEEY